MFPSEEQRRPSVPPSRRGFRVSSVTYKLELSQQPSAPLALVLVGADDVSLTGWLGGLDERTCDQCPAQRGQPGAPDIDQYQPPHLHSSLLELNSRGPVTRAPFAKAAPDRLWKRASQLLSKWHNKAPKCLLFANWDGRSIVA